MDDNQQRFLELLGHLPARLTAEQAAWVINCQTHDIPVLMNAKLIKPLGHPPQNAGKFFATADLLEAGKDRNWLVRVSSTIYQHWHKKNIRKKEPVEGATGEPDRPQPTFQAMNFSPDIPASTMIQAQFHKETALDPTPICRLSQL